MRRNKIIFAIVTVLFVSCALFFGLRNKPAEAELPAWLPKNLRESVSKLNPEDSAVKALVAEINSIHIKDPSNPPELVIEKIEHQISGIKRQESLHKPIKRSPQSKKMPLSPKEMAKDSAFPYKPHIIYPDDPDFAKATMFPASFTGQYKITSAVEMPYAILYTMVERGKQDKNVTGRSKGDPTLGIIMYTIINPDNGYQQINGKFANFPGYGAPTAVKIIKNIVYIRFANGKLLAFDTKYPPEMHFVLKIP